MSESADEIPYPVAWKRDYLSFEEAIEAFQERQMTDVESHGNVVRLLNHHLDRCRELLWAHVNGGLDDHYADEIRELKDV